MECTYTHIKSCPKQQQQQQHQQHQQQHQQHHHHHQQQQQQQQQQFWLKSWPLVARLEPNGCHIFCGSGSRPHVLPSTCGQMLSGRSIHEEVRSRDDAATALDGEVTQRAPERMHARVVEQIVDLAVPFLDLGENPGDHSACSSGAYQGPDCGAYRGRACAPDQGGHRAESRRRADR